MGYGGPRTGRASPMATRTPRVRVEVTALKLSNVRSVSAGTLDAEARFAVAGISTAIGDVRPRSDSPRRQGRYVLGDLLGRGGMAEVFSGYVIGSHGFQKPVAIKRLLPELANDHTFVERLIGE